MVLSKGVLLINGRIIWNASDYAQNSSPQTSWGIELIVKLDLAGSQSLLDVGCGDGKLTAYMAQKFPSSSITGIDISPEMVRYARERFSHVPNLRFIQMDACSMAFHEPFDMVFSSTALHWVKDHRPVLQGMYRSLKPGAGVLLQMGSVSSDYGLVAPAANVILSDEYIGFFQNFDYQFASYSPGEYIRLLEENGFTPVKVEVLCRPMRHTDKAGLAGFIRASWMPFTNRVPEGKREAFIDAVVEEYLKENPAGEGNAIEIQTSRLQVEAVRQ